MSKPKAFQTATIETVLRSFDKRRNVRRFLVADEVGLGKTVVARGVIERLIARNISGYPLRVFYVCSSLAIAIQNRESLLNVIQDPSDRSCSFSEVDRITLAPNQKLANDVPLHLYTLTPGTSIPDRKGMRRTGTVQERALLHNILLSRYPLLTRIKGEKEEWLCRNARKSWSAAKQWDLCQPSEHLISGFFSVLRKKLKLNKGQHLPTAISKFLIEDQLETIGIFRIALAETALNELSPDLVIFDEFQRFQDLFDGSDQGSRIAQRMVRTGQGGPAVLLLSATPYRVYGGEIDRMFGDSEHHVQFYRLVKWLYGDDQVACNKSNELKQLFQRYGEALKSTNPTGRVTINLKKKIEAKLRPVIARTERFSHRAGQDAAELVEVEAPLSTDDLKVFDHTVSCFLKNNSGDVVNLGVAIAYWSSVPLPMQTLGPDYKAWVTAERISPRKRALQISKNDVREFRGPISWPHPKLRALHERIQPENLSTPWLAPSMPWWPMGGKWLNSPAEKVLVFSRFRAVPRTLAGLLSYEVERRLLRRTDLLYSDVSNRTPLSPSRENLAFFQPSLVLANLLDPWKCRADNIYQIKRNALQQVETALKNLGVEVNTDRNTARQLPELLVLLERRTSVWAQSKKTWLSFATSLSRTDDLGESSLYFRVLQWDNAVNGRLESVNREELRLLMNASLSSPGSVLTRTFLRHIPSSESAQSFFSHLLKVCWVGLRSYFNNPWMEASMNGRGGYRARISRNILEGNLESVLDEHLWVTKTLRPLNFEGLLDGLTTALSLRTADVKIYGYNGIRSAYHVRSHAALAFNEAVRRHNPVQSENEHHKVRTDEVRVAFNSPFWPHMLATTSVGQEGLDFHTWCSAVAHWDLPGNPVDLEQREGRIDRYAGLSTRRAIASKCFVSTETHSGVVSPWSILADKVDELHEKDSIGLEPWWIVEGTRIKRLVFDVPLSEAKARLQDLLQKRLLYRLTLGQPNQSDLVKALQGRVAPDDAVALTINLSAIC